MRQVADFLRTLGADEADCRELSVAGESMVHAVGNGAITALVDEYISGTAPYTELTRRLNDAAESAGVHPYTVNALFVAAVLLAEREEYTACYGEEIFRDTARDLVWKLRECHQIHRIAGVPSSTWYDRILRREIFALGRLQFHTVPFHLDTVILKDGVLAKGDRVIKVHIPSSGALPHEACLDSYRRAYRFFRHEFLGDALPFVCYSWLLGPRIAAGYREGSNLASFYGDYQVFQQKDDPTHDDFWRIFGFPYREGLDLTALPRDTALRAHVADIYAKGSGIQIGYGAFYHDGEKILS